jgi:uncharacterized protein
MSKAQKPRQKHVPQRTCIACRQTEGKREFVRIVRTLGGEVCVDPTGKQAGRGAYLHKARSCWDQALNGQKLNTALKTTVTPENLAMLKAYATTLPEVVATD